MEDIRVVFVCLGNICRSPMAEYVFKHVVDRRGLSRRFDIWSAASFGYHTGEPPDRRTVATLRNHEIPYDGCKRALRIAEKDFQENDYVIAMDDINFENMMEIRPVNSKAEVHLMMEFAGGGNVEDPYYDGNFEGAYVKVLKGCEGLLDHIIQQHPEIL